MHRLLLSRRNRQLVAVLDRDLPDHECALIIVVIRQPASGRLVVLVLVGLRVERLQVHKVVRVLLALITVPGIRAGVPGVGQGHHMIDLDLAIPALEPDPLRGVAVTVQAQRSFGQHAASGAGFGMQIDHVPAQHVGALIAAVAINVSPGLAELGALAPDSVTITDFKIV